MGLYDEVRADKPHSRLYLSAQIAKEKELQRISALILKALMVDSDKIKAQRLAKEYVEKVAPIRRLRELRSFLASSVITSARLKLQLKKLKETIEKQEKFHRSIEIEMQRLQGIVEREQIENREPLLVWFKLYKTEKLGIEE